MLSIWVHHLPKTNSNNITVISTMGQSIIHLKDHLRVLVLGKMEQGHTSLSHYKTWTEYLSIYVETLKGKK